MAATAAGVTVFLAAHVLGWVDPSLAAPLWTCVAAILLGNFAFLSLRSRLRRQRPFLLAQMAFDLVLLTFLLHFSGGLENPLYVLYVFHVLMAGILLSVSDAWLVTAMAGGLFCCLSFGEYAGLWPHYRLLAFASPERLREVVGMTATFLGLLAGTAYFITTIMGRLRDSQERLLKAERLGALGQIVGFIAHEVNNPIGIISARMKLLRSGSPEFRSGEFLEESLEIVDRQSDRVGRVVQRLLRLLKPSSEPRGEVDVNEVLCDALATSAAQARARGIEVRRDLRAVAPVRASYDDLFHAYLNVIHNAIEAMPRGGRLGAATREAGGWIETVISDTGEGIAPEHLRKIFEPLFSTKTADHGTGLGLPISLSFVKAHGGEILVDGGVGRG
ncbi:MAG: hypothetical protein KGK30_09480, partial [Elusimicrobia bacterium]|nr:hypothetical protein [Elusimicrobiota bacterium]